MKICFEKNINIDNNIHCIGYDSPLWDKYKGAYGNVVEYIQMLMGDKEIVSQQRINRIDQSQKSETDIVLQNLFENLWHQMSFYNATYLAIPYLVKLLDDKEKNHDFQGQLNLISEIGVCLMCDIPSLHYEPIDNEEILQNYEKSVLLIQEKTKLFVETYLEELQKLEENEKSYFCMSLLAILGDREAAYVLTSVMFDECYVLCQNCEYCDEEMEPLSEGQPENIIPAQSVIGKWDGHSLNDTYVLFSHILDILCEKSAVQNLSYYYGTYTCPKCGSQGLVIDLMKNYFFEM